MTPSFRAGSNDTLLCLYQETGLFIHEPKDSPGPSEMRRILSGEILCCLLRNSYTPDQEMANCESFHFITTHFQTSFPDLSWSRRPNWLQWSRDPVPEQMDQNQVQARDQDIYMSQCADKLFAPTFLNLNFSKYLKTFWFALKIYCYILFGRRR